MGTNILVVDTFYHGNVATMIIDEEIVATTQKECLTNKKHDAIFLIARLNLALPKQI